MRSAELGRGRRLLVVLEPGDDVLEALAQACSEAGVRHAIIPVFLGAFSTVTLIGTRDEVIDPDAPLPASCEVRWVEGIGSATVAPDASGVPVVHLHAAVGDKLAGALGYTGHVLAATTHYTAEVVIDEVLGADLVRLPTEATHGIPTLHWR